MSDSVERRSLARAAAHLATRCWVDAPALALMTDDERLADPLAAALALPRGSMVVVRARDAIRRADLAKAIMKLSRLRSLIVLIADDAALAVSCDADGLHLPEACLGDASHQRARHPRWLISASVHSLAALGRAMRLPVDAVFLSPVFATKSHPGRAALTPVRANLIARAARVPVYALGGVNAHNAGRLAESFAGIAAIGALDVQA